MSMQDPLASLTRGAQFLYRLATEAVFKGAAVTALKVGRKLDNALELKAGNYVDPYFLKDESLGHWLARAGGGDPTFVNNLVSAMTHGITGGDAWRLSSLSSFVTRMRLLQAIKQPPGHACMFSKDLALLAALSNKSEKFRKTLKYAEERGGMMSFTGGFGTFTDALAKAVAARKVKIVKNRRINQISYDSKQDKVKVSITFPRRRCHGLVII